MPTLVAFADNSGSGVDLGTILVWVGIIGAICVAALFPIRYARVRNHVQSQAIFAIIVFWAIATAAVSIGASFAQLNWNAEWNRRVASGYFDPNNISDKPNLPWLWWGALAVAYVGVLAWSMVGATTQTGSRQPAAPDRSEELASYSRGEHFEGQSGSPHSR